jgi:hypothetical protein
MKQNNAILSTLKIIQDDLTALYKDSDGVAGWNMNGTVADWDDIGMGIILEDLDNVIKMVEKE